MELDKMLIELENFVNDLIGEIRQGRTTYELGSSDKDLIIDYIEFKYKEFLNKINPKTGKEWWHG